MRTLLLGLAETGKTTYLAAVWHVVNSGEVEGALELDALPADTQHLNRLLAKWHSGERQDHTSSNVEHTSELTLSAIGFDEPVQYTLPDFSGDLIRDYLEAREWPEEFDVFVRDSSGILLFVNPQAVFRNPWIEDTHLAMAEANPNANRSSPEPESDPDEWNPATMMPTDTLMADLLEVVLERRGTAEGCKVGVIVSAWDIVMGTQTPGEYLEKELPLLHQLLSARADEFEWRVYGVSAQGGRLPEDSADLIAHTKQSDRIIVELEHERTTDITAPLRWLAARS